MQPMCLCIFSGRQFENSFEKAQCRKVKQMQPMQCNYASFHASHFRKHLKTHGGEKTIKCNLCDFASYDAVCLRRHLKIHNGKKSHKCDLCGYASTRADVLRTHVKTHSGEKANCNQCGFTSSDRQFEDTFKNAQRRKDKQM